MKTKFIYLFLVGLTFGFIGFSNVNAEEVTPTKEWCFAFEEETGTITGYYFKNYSYYKCGYDVVIPETIKGVEVKRIGNKAFMNDGIESVVIPETVTSIGNLAFASNDFQTDVVIPDTVTRIGYGAFNDNQNLVEIIGSELEFLYARSDSNEDGIAEIDYTKLIGVAGWSWDGYPSITVPNGVKTIGTKAFYGINSYDEEIVLNLPRGLKTIEEKAFYGSNIFYFNVPTSVETADFSVDTDQIPYSDEVVYFNWFTWKYDDESGDYTYEPYTFESGKEADVYRELYYRPYVYYLEGYSTNYNKVRLNWEFEEPVDYVQIYRYNSSTGRYELNFSTYNQTGIYMTKGLVAGKTYYYKVRGVITTPDGKKHYSEFSDYIAVKPIPNAPTKVKATKYRSGVAKITWAKVDGADGYTIYKYNSSKKLYYSVKSVTGTSTTTSYGLKKGYGYYYRVKAYKIVDGKKVYSKLSASTYVRV